MQSELDIQGLVSALSAEDKLIRRRAAAALRSMRAVAAIPALKEAYQNEEDPETEMAIAHTIESLTDFADGRATETGQHSVVSEEAQVKGLIEQLQSDNASKIVAAAEKLGEMGQKIAVESLILAFNNPKHTIHVRLAIAEALLKLESAPVEVALLANLRHPDWHIRRNGAAILGQLRAEWAIQPLARCLKDPHPVVRRTALAALKHIGTPESRKALAQFAPSETAARPQKPAKSTPKSVSGIEIKRPGKQSEDEDASSLLKRLNEKDKNDAAQRGTQPLSMSNLRKQIEATQPIGSNMLEQLDALLEDDDSDGDDE